MADNEELIKELQRDLQSFRNQYDEDMRGDMKLGNGDSGIIGAIRDIREHNQNYPSLTYLLKKRTWPTLVTILGAHLFLTMLWIMGLLSWLMEWFGLPPFPTP